MKRSTIRIVPGLLVAIGAWTAPDSLGNGSPFRPAAAIGDAPTDTPLKFLGVLVDRGNPIFRLYDPSSGLAMWVGMKEVGNPFVVQDYDADKCTAKVDYKGRSLTLALKQAKVVALEQPQVPVVAEPAADAVSADASEASDMDAVVDGIRRRRALRAQATQTPAPRPRN